jgi:hypothetical protein
MSTKVGLAQVAVLAVLAVSLLGCDPGHSVGVRGIITQPLERDCILQALHNPERIANVSIHEPTSRKVWNFRDGSHEEKTPAQYVVESSQPMGDRKIAGVITQREDQERRVNFSASTIWLGLPRPPAEVQQETQIFNAYLARRISQLCNAKFAEHLKYIPDDKSCEEELSRLDQE